MSKHIHKLNMSMERAQWIAQWVEQDWNNLYQFSNRDRSLWAEYDNGNMRRKMTELRAQQQQRPRFPGAAQCVIDSSEK